jgi:hypothetical protein
VKAGIRWLDRNVLTWLGLPLVIAGGTVANAVAVETTATQHAA